MNVDDLLSRLRKTKVDLKLDGDELNVNAPKGVLDVELVESIKANKAAIIDVLRSAKRRSFNEYPAIKRVDSGEGCLPSFAQERLWFLDQLKPDNPFYNMPLVIGLQGRLNLSALFASLKLIVARHDTLRTRFVIREGQPVQVIDQDADFEVQEEDISALQEAARKQALADLIATEALQPFNLEKDRLVRAGLIRNGEDDHVLLFTMHHIVSDGWSLSVLYRELTSSYAAFCSGQQPDWKPLAVQYADFAAWQRDWLSGDVLASQLGYWKQKLTNLPTLDLPVDRPRPPVQTFSGAMIDVDLSRRLSRQLSIFAQQESVSLFMVLLSAFSVLLNRYSGQKDIVVGSPIANRNQAELEDLIGFFVNSLVMRTDVSGNPAFREVLQRVNHTALGAYDHQDLPFEKLVDEIQTERDLSQNPVFQVMFALQNTPQESLEFKDLTLQVIHQEIRTTRFDLEVHVWEDEDSVSLSFIYNTDLFDAGTIERMFSHYRTLLESMVASPDMRIGDAPMLGEQERQQLVSGWNETATDYPRDQTVQSLFEAQAAATPDAIAVAYGDQQLSYRELNERANQLAHYLQSKGVGAEVKVGLFVERSPEMVIAVLGILKAGGAYLPLDLDYPSSRIAFMLTDAQVPVLLTTSKLTARLPEQACELVCLDNDWAQIEQERADNPEIMTTADSLAYVIYTSGSTGIPKGVEIPQRAINRLVRNTDYYQADATDRIAQASSISFDAATFELWGALLNGAQLVGVDKDTLLNSKALAALLQEKGVTAMFMTTAVFNQVAREVPDAFSGLRAVMFGGEAVDPAAVRRVLANHPPQRLLHVYGPTESTTFATWYPIESVAEDAITVPIGRPLANTTLYVLDANQSPVPVGVSGELYIGGDGLAQGYLNQPELTADRFVANPFDANSKLYRTGDKVRYLADGSIEFQGRFDHQIKLRGFRIELGEIETALVKHEALQDAVAIVREDEPGDKRIAAYLVASPEWVEQISSGQSGEHVDEWQALYEDTYGNIDDSQDLISNFTGWNSSYTGEPIPLAEMEEWQDATVSRIAALQPRKVLEIGCGTGLLLYRLASDCERYVGADFSAVAQAQVQGVVSTREEYKHVELWQRTADDFSEVKPGDFDTVIINSVTQYLPSMDYLADVVAGSVEAIADGGRMMLGDLRSLPLLKAYHTSVQLYLSPDEASGAELLRNIQQHVEEENELVIEPSFFHALKQKIPRISHVEVLLKQGQYHNELTGYRYDVILHVEAQAEELPENGQWLDWGGSDLDSAQLQTHLNENPQWLGINAIPNARITSHVAVLEQLQGEGSGLSVGELREQAMQQPSIEPATLWQMAEKSGYQLELSYSGAGTDGRMDALFRRSRRQDCAGYVFWSQQQSVPERAWSAYGTNPLKGRLGNELIPLLREDLQQDLPEYMLPSVYVVLDALPLNPNGKVDRKALPVPGDVRASLGAEYTAPRNEMEQQLAGIWGEVLKLEQVGVHDNFFDLGGHSLMATQVVSRVREQLNVELPLSEMFGYPTVAELAPVVRALLDEHGGEEAEVIPLADRNKPLPLSFAQERFWFLNQLEPESSAYNVLLALKMKGELNVAALTNSLNSIVRRHESLRTHFALHQGKPIQIIDEVSIELAQSDLSTLAGDALQREVRTRVNKAGLQSFDLSTGPLLRCRLLQLSETEHVLLLSMHHIVSDGWSLGVLFRELSVCYAALSKGEQPDLPEMPIQYADFALWQREYISGEVLASLQAYWQHKLADLSTLDLPTDRPRPAIQSHAGAFEILLLDAELSEQLAVLSKQAGVTLFMTLLSAFAVLMQRYSGQDDMVVGTPIANRNRSEVEGLIGFFINSLVMRTDVSGNPGFQDLLVQVQETALEAYQHQDMPFENLVEILQPSRDRGRNPLFQVQFAVQNAPMEPLELEGLTYELMKGGTQQTIFDLECHIGTRGTEFDIKFVYNTELFDAATIQRMQEHYSNLLRSVVADPARPVAELSMHSAKEQQQFADWNQTTLDYPRDATIAGLFEQQVLETTTAEAVEYDGNTLSYSELNRQANQLARYLQQRGAGAGTIVGICVERSLEMVVGLMAILKAGGAYLPLDPGYPVERLNYMLEDSGAQLLLSKASLPGGLVMPDSRVVCLDRDAVAIAEQDDANLASTVTADDLAYVIYTSGSTGKPKGVMGLQRGLVNRLSWGWATYPYTAGECCCQKTTLNFVDSVAEIFSPLLAGLCLVVVDEATLKDVRALAKLVSSRGVTRLMMVPSLLRALLELDEEALSGLECVRHWVAGGERLEAELEVAFRAHFPGAVLLNFYGSSEASADVTCFDTAERGERAGSLIGRPIANMHVYVLDDWMNTVPVGVPGELYVGGDGLARGYQNRAQLTAEKFVPDPFSDEPGARLYRTGDRVRYLADGNLEFLGRTDDQVKLRGFRIELGEIESELLQLTAVNDAVVAVREDDAGDRRLDAYVVPTAEWIEQNPSTGDAAENDSDTEESLSRALISELRQQLRQQLPPYMVPSVFVVLQALPLNPNGKVDRKALPVPGDVRASLGAEYTAPRNEMEQQLAGIWGEVLKLEQVGVHDNFFDLGGHSLMATQVVSRIRSQLNVELPLSEMFGYPTVAELAPVVETLLDEHGADEAEVIPLADRSQPLPLSFAQERLWFLDQLEPGNPAYNIPMALRLKGELSIDALTSSLHQILQRHEVLRTRFVDGPNGPVQMIDAQVSFDLSQTNLSDLSAEAQDKELMEQLQGEAIRPFDLAADQLLRGLLLRLGEHEHVLLLTLHHIIADGWSLGVLFRELGSCYAAYSEERQPQLVGLPIQYADFAAWQRDWLSGAQLERQLGYWSRQLADLTTLGLPTDFSRPPMQSFRGASLSLSLGDRLSTQLESFSKRSGNTLFMTLLGAYALMMQRYSGQDDVVIGSPIANRNRSELEELIAFFVNMLVLRVDCSGSLGFADFMKRLNGMVMEAFEHQDIPFEKLLEALQTERDPSRNPLFQVHFALQNAPMERLDLAGLTLEFVNKPVQMTRFDLECHCWRTDHGLGVTFVYNTELFEAATIERMLNHYKCLLESIVADPELSIDALTMQSEAEKGLLLQQWNQTDQDYPRELTLQQLFEAQVERSPDAVALEYEGQSLSYVELDALANRLAHQLQGQGIGPGQLVGVHMLRSLEMVIALYAILKAGGAYVPLDPDYPQDRIAYMAAEAELTVVLTQAGLQDDLSGTGATFICVDQAALSATAAVDSITSTASADDLAYVIYTSGSTGKPKGVMNCHSGIVNRLQWMQQAYALSAEDRVLQKTPYSFDVSVWEFFWPLINGARLVIAKPEGHKDPVYLSRLIKHKQISTLHFVPSMLKVFLDNTDAGEFSSVKRVICSGEALPYELQQQFFSLHQAELHNLYGPTEAAVDVSYWACRADDERRLVPIGRPVANTRLYILDRRMQPVPIGVSGELYIGGVQVARGYLGQPELTAERFIADPFSDQPGARLYRTGDLARYLSDGAIEYLGRIDNQIKLRGLRIELGEIETELGSHEAVREVVVVAREDQPGDKRLVAYMVAAQAWLEKYSGEHVSEWQTLYEETYRQGAGDQDARFNIVSWNSSYTGEPIATEQMREWVDVTVTRIAALEAQRVLEIGCGKGLLLYRLAPGCTRYVGADFSAVAQQQLQAGISEDEELRHVELWHRSTDDFSAVEAGDFDLVVINSVVQYLPSVDYLLEVLSGAVAAVASGGQVFVGDLRSFPLLTAYHASVEAYRSADDVTGMELLRSVQQHVEEENELVVEPAFFHALKQRIPRISHVEVLLKQGEYTNELSAFRYDVILHVESESTGLVGNGQWHEWGHSGYDEAELKALLAPADQDWLGIHAIPNARYAAGLALLEQIQGDHAAMTLGDLKPEIDARVAQAIDPASLWRLAESCGYELELGYAGSGQDGRIEVMFRRISRADSADKVFWEQTQTVSERPWNDFASNPLKGRLGRELIPQLKDDLRQSLPEYMLPSVFVVLDTLPLNPNGKVDRKALPVPGDVRASLGAEYLAPRTDLEQQLAQVWAEVLKLERVGIHDNFFNLGGHSLLATQVVSRVREQQGVELPLSEMFSHPTVAEMAPLVESLREGNQDQRAEMLQRIRNISPQEKAKLLAAARKTQVLENE